MPGLNFNPAGTPAQVGKKEADSGPKALPSLTFQPLSDETAQKLGMFSSGAPAATAGSAPGTAERSAGVGADSVSMPLSGNSSAAKAPAPTAGSMGGSLVSPYSYQSYFPGPFGMMRLESVTEAVAPGATGTFKTLQDKVAGPVLAEWSADANLVETNASVDENGGLAATQEAFPGQFGWRFTYAASSQREVLMFLVTPRETRVLRFRWVPVVIDPESIAVDTSDAIAKVVAAIKDPSLESKEEELGHDYFFSPTDKMSGPGYAYGSGAGAIPAAKLDAMPMPMRLPIPAPTSRPGFSPPPDMPTPPPFYWSEKVTEEPIRELRPGGRWSVSLQPITKYVVWNLYYNNYVPMPVPASAGVMAKLPAEPAVYEGPKEGATRTWESYYVSAMVDARTGDLIRVSRPKRYTAVTIKVPIDSSKYPYGMPFGTPMPVPLMLAR